MLNHLFVCHVLLVHESYLHSQRTHVSRCLTTNINPPLPSSLFITKVLCASSRIMSSNVWRNTSMFDIVWFVRFVFPDKTLPFYVFYIHKLHTFVWILFQNGPFNAFAINLACNLYFCIGSEECRNSSFKWNMYHLNGRISDTLRERWDSLYEEDPL